MSNNGAEAQQENVLYTSSCRFRDEIVRLSLVVGESTSWAYHRSSWVYRQRLWGGYQSLKANFRYGQLN